MSAADQLKTAIKQSGLTVTAISVRSGITRCYIYDLLNGTATPSHGLCIQLADGLSLDRDEVIGWWWDSNGQKLRSAPMVNE